MLKMDLRQGDCLEVMKTMEDNSIDLTVTSPPYDNLRTYNGNIEQWSFDKFKGIAKELYRITKQGGVVVWIVGDATVKGSESGTSFKQALWFMECGFKLHDTMIYAKENYVPLTHKRYEQAFEYMFVFLKGKIKTFNPIMIECKTAGSKTEKRTFYQTKEQNLPTKSHNIEPVKPTKQKSNIWFMATNAGCKGHPAQFPEQLANDHIVSWSNPGDTIFDPFMGSGTTGKMALLNNRNFIGIELDEEYFTITENRIKQANEDDSAIIRSARYGFGEDDE